jgi:6-phospho-beta-glucosidase
VIAAAPVRFSASAAGRLRLTIVGGTSPFVCDLLAALASPSPSTAWEVRLLGRDPDAMAAMRAFGLRRLRPPHSCVVTDDPAAALEGADCVVVQPRIGGLAARADDEAMAQGAGAPADEGLGPGGLRAALRAAPVLRGLAADLAAHCPDALVIGFSNPLSTTVSVLSRAGRPTVGVCELPLVTAKEVAHVLGLPLAGLEWSFSGLNHRGFLHGIRYEGRDQWPILVARMRQQGRSSLGGVSRDLMESLSALPLKYHPLLAGLDVPPAGRARELMEIRARAWRELGRHPGVMPPSIAARSMPWYREAVVPLLLSLGGHGTRNLVLDVMCDDGVVRELQADVDAGGAAAATGSTRPLSSEARGWLARFEAHERAVDAVLEDPTMRALTSVLTLDPATPDHAVDRVARILMPLVDDLRAAPVRQDWWGVHGRR